MGFSYSTKPHGIAYKKGAKAISAIREKEIEGTKKARWQDRAQRMTGTG